MEKNKQKSRWIKYLMWGTKQPSSMGFSSNQVRLILNSIAALSPYLLPQSSPDSEHQDIADFETEFLCVPLANLEFLL